MSSTIKYSNKQLKIRHGDLVRMLVAPWSDGFVLTVYDGQFEKEVEIDTRKTRGDEPALQKHKIIVGLRSLRLLKTSEELKVEIEDQYDKEFSCEDLAGYIHMN